jgi:hypothetical protein
MGNHRPFILPEIPRQKFRYATERLYAKLDFQSSVDNQSQPAISA